MKTRMIITSAIAAILLTLTSFTNNRENFPEPVKMLTDDDFCTVQGLFYTVQFGVYSAPIPETAFPKIPVTTYCVKRPDGLYSYFCGIFDCRFSAMEKRFDVVSSGYYDAYVAVYYNGQQISMPKADDLIAEHGQDIIYNAETVPDNLTQLDK